VAPGLKGGDKLKKAIKFGSLKSLMPKKVVRIILWTFICMVILRGIGSILRPNQTSKVVDQVNSSLTADKSINNSMNEAAAFAESFAIEYFSYKQNAGDDYKKRLVNYMNQSALSSLSASPSSDVQAISSTALSKRVYKENSFNVDVKVKIKYIAKDITKDVFITVPVATKDGKYVVEDVPLIIARPIAAEIKSQQYEGTSVEASISRPIEEMLNNFFKVYCEGNEGEIKYYLSDSSKTLRGLDGNYKFRNLGELNVFGMGDGSYLTLVSYVLEDNETKQEVKQKVNITVVNKEDRYYIKDINTRTANLK
jgi:hypothetical protein